MTAGELLSLPNFGPTNLYELRNRIADLGVFLFHESTRPPARLPRPDPPGPPDPRLDHPWVAAWINSCTPQHRPEMLEALGFAMLVTGKAPIDLTIRDVRVIKNNEAGYDPNDVQRDLALTRLFLRYIGVITYPPRPRSHAPAPLPGPPAKNSNTNIGLQRLDRGLVRGLDIPGQHVSPVLSSMGSSVRVVERQPTLRTGAPSANQPGPHGTWGWARRWTRPGHPPDMSGHAGGQHAGISVQPRERPGLVPVTPSNEEAPPVIAQPELPGFQQDPEHPLTRELLRQQIDEFVEDAYAGDGGILLADGYDEPLIGFGAQQSKATCAIDDTDAVIALLIDRDRLTHEDAIEWSAFNGQGAWVGEQTPIVFHRFVPDPAWKPGSPDLRIPGAVMILPTDFRELAQSLSERLGPAAMNVIITLLGRHKHEKHP